MFRVSSCHRVCAEGPRAETGHLTCGSCDVGCVAVVASGRQRTSTYRFWAHSFATAGEVGMGGDQASGDVRGLEYESMYDYEYST